MFAWEKLKHVDTLTDIQRAARFYYLQQQGFGGKLNSNFGISTTSGPGLNLLRIEENLSQAHLRLARVFVENMDWKAVMKRYDRPHTLHYLDPPYWATAGYTLTYARCSMGCGSRRCRSTTRWARATARRPRNW